MSRQVSTGTLAGLPLWYFPEHSGPFSLAIPPWMGVMTIAMVPATAGKKQRVLWSSRPCYQHWWHTGSFYASL